MGENAGNFNVEPTAKTAENGENRRGGCALCKKGPDFTKKIIDISVKKCYIFIGKKIPIKMCGGANPTAAA